MAAVTTPRAIAAVFFTSAAVLVLEILAGRLMAPYVGISLETYTGIIGTVLAGIAVGTRPGGRLADRYDPRRAARARAGRWAARWPSLSCRSSPCSARGVGTGPVAIVLLTAAAFFLPAAVLSAVSPMVGQAAPGRPGRDRHGGGRAVGRGHGRRARRHVPAPGSCCVAALPSRPIVIGVGTLLIVAGLVCGLRRRGAARRRAGGARSRWSPAGCGRRRQRPCQYETAYFCVRVEADPHRPSGRILYLDRLRHSYVDLDDPTHLEFRYIRLFARRGRRAARRAASTRCTSAAAASPSPATSPPRRPGSDSRVLEIDGELVRHRRGRSSAWSTGPDLGSARATPAWPSATCRPTPTTWWSATPSAAWRCPGT